MKLNRWGMVYFLAGCGAVNYADRAAFGLAAPMFSKELDIGPAELGILLSAFSIGYAIFNFVGGLASDRYGAKRVFGWALALWSIFCASIAGTFDFASMFVARVLFGAAEGPFAALVNKITNNWFRKDEAAAAVGIGNAGNPFGAAIAGPIVGYIAAAWGWRVPFVIFGLIGLVVAIAWTMLASERPSGGPTNQPLENDNTHAPLSFYLRQPSILITAFAFFAINYLLFFFLSWFPKYLVDVLHLSVANMGLVTMIPWALGIVGIGAGGFLTDMAARHMDRTLSRKLILGGFLFLSSLCIAMAGIATETPGAVALTAFAVLFMYLAASTPWIIVQDIVEPALVGSVGGFNHMLANLGGFCAPLITGLIIEATGQYASAFILAGAIGIAAVIGVFLLLKPIRRDSVAFLPAADAS
jgi:ACS family hexuronate transporter-like MFS transporter